MKIILNESYGDGHQPAIALGKFLRDVKRKDDIFVYVYDLKHPESNTYIRESLEEYEKRTDMRHQHNYHADFISRTDLGEEYLYAKWKLYGIEHRYYLPLVDSEDIMAFASILESLPENFRHQLVVMDIPKGKKYRICQYDGSEYYELEDEIEWEVADW